MHSAQSPIPVGQARDLSRQRLHPEVVSRTGKLLSWACNMSVRARVLLFPLWLAAVRAMRPIRHGAVAGYCAGSRVLISAHVLFISCSERRKVLKGENRMSALGSRNYEGSWFLSRLCRAYVVREYSPGCRELQSAGWQSAKSW